MITDHHAYKDPQHQGSCKCSKVMNTEQSGLYLGLQLIKNTYDRPHADTHISYIILFTMFSKKKKIKKEKFYMMSLHERQVDGRAGSALADSQLLQREGSGWEQGGLQETFYYHQLIFLFHLPFPIFTKLYGYATHSALNKIIYFICTSFLMFCNVENSF